MECQFLYCSNVACWRVTEANGLVHHICTSDLEEFWWGLLIKGVFVERV